MSAELASPSSHEIFVHIRIIIGMILGISVSRIIIGATRFIQHPGKEKIYLTHFGWVIYIFLFIIHFWWFEFAHSQTKIWTFGLYLLLIFYAIIFAMLAAMLFPDHINEYDGFRGYFFQRRSWFYALFLTLLVVDVIDTYAKGQKYYHHYGLAYPVRQFLLTMGAAGGLVFRSERYDIVYISLALAAQVVWIGVLFNILN